MPYFYELEEKYSEIYKINTESKDRFFSNFKKNPRENYEFIKKIHSNRNIIAQLCLTFDAEILENKIFSDFKETLINYKINNKNINDKDIYEITYLLSNFDNDLNWNIFELFNSRLWLIDWIITDKLQEKPQVKLQEKSQVKSQVKSHVLEFLEKNKDTVDLYDLAYK